MDIVSRRDAGLPPAPSSIGHRSPSSWAGIRVHHTGGSFSSWPAIHQWQTAGRPPDQRLAYIGYSFGVAGGRVTELRGFDHHPAHDFINTHLGVVFGGSFGSSLPPAADLEALVWFIGEAERRCGKRLPVSTHREVGQTSCPGDRLHRWVKQALPGLLEDDMPTVHELWNTDGVVRAPGSREDNADNPHWTPANILRSARQWAYRAAQDTAELRTRLAALEAAVAGEDLAAAVRTELDRHRVMLLAELAEDLAQDVAERLLEVPAERVREAVTEALRARDLRAAGQG